MYDALNRKRVKPSHNKLDVYSAHFFQTNESWMTLTLTESLVFYFGVSTWHMTRDVCWHSFFTIVRRHFSATLKNVLRLKVSIYEI